MTKYSSPSHQHHYSTANRSGRNSSKFRKVIREYKHGRLHSGSKHGPLVRSTKQAVAIAYNEQLHLHGKK